MEKKIVTLEDFTVVGMECNGLQEEMTALWDVFNEREKEIDTPFNGVCYGLSYDMTANGQFKYMAGMKVAAVNHLPAGMKAKQIQGGKFAVFTFKDDVSKMGQFFEAIYKEYLPSLGLIPDNRTWFEYYDERFFRNGECDIYAAIV